MSNVLVIAPHPDDEAIGCGGTIAMHVAKGDIVEVIFLTSGEKGGHGLSTAETIKIREAESVKAAAILQLSDFQFWREPDGNFQETEKNVARLQKKIIEFQPEIIYVPHNDESHTDHKAAAELVRKSVNISNEKTQVLMYEVWTPTQKLDHIVDISEYVEIKRAAILAYKSQCDVLKFDAAILGLNRYRGEMHSWPGGDYAEVFKNMNAK